MAMEAQWYRNQGHNVDWGNPYGLYDKYIHKPEGLPFLSLPSPDRIWSKAKDYTSGNYKYLPGTHMQVASGCWHGKCTFCVEKNTYPQQVRSINDVIGEIHECCEMGFKEIFDDSPTFPLVEPWFSEFCSYAHSFNLSFGCNMRMIDIDYEKMKWAGFRMLLFGLESANQQTLDKIQKGTKVEDVKYIIKAAKAGLEPHIAVMFGYPGETDKDALRTLHLVHYLLKKGYAKTAQASFYSPVGGGGKLKHKKYIRQIYSVCSSPAFWFNKIKSIKNEADLKYLWKQIKVGLNEIQ